MKNDKLLTAYKVLQEATEKYAETLKEVQSTCKHEWKNMKGAPPRKAKRLRYCLYCELWSRG